MELSNKKTVLITGASGFIGLNTVKVFSKDDSWEIYALVHKSISVELKNLPKINIIQGNLNDYSFIKELEKKYNFDVIVHIAGLASDIGKDKIFKKINYESVKSLSPLAKEKFIYISSTDVYGIKDFNNADENTPLCEFPKNPYPKYKILSEKYIKENCKNYVIIRPAAVWGENDRTLESRVVDFLKTSPFIVHFGKWKGKNRWPLANVNNVSNTILIVSKTNKFDKEAINIVDKNVITIDDYYKTIAKKYFPEKKFKTITLPLWIGKIIGLISTTISNLLNLNHPIFDPSFYALHHVSSNLDFSSEKMESVLSTFE